MVRIFVKETGEIIEYGDVVEITFSKDIEDGKAVITKEVKVSPETIGFLLKEGILEERTVEDDLIHFDEADDMEDCPFKEDLNSLKEAISNLTKEVSKLGDIIAEEKKAINSLKSKMDTRNTLFRTK